MLRILNSQSRQKEDFKPLDPAGKHVRMYTCGPTVYDSLHIGHARAYIAPDVVRRYLEYKGYQVRHVSNFTDVDDKIIKRAIEERRDWREITSHYIAEAHRLLMHLNVMPADAYPRATDHVVEMQEIVKRLLASKNAYIAKDGDIYFDTTSYARYGALSGRKLEDDEAGASGRVDDARMALKKHPGDFILWKLSKNDRPEIAKGGENVPRWPSPWGDGRPGWHLECSAMSHKYMGVPFDIHCGGQDLLFPHHEDEKAQTECAYCGELKNGESVRYWVHNAFINMKARPEDGAVNADYVDQASGGVKMSKSLGNVKWVREMIWPEGPYDPMAVRMLMLSSHYRSPIVFEPAQLDEATARLERLYNALEALDRASHQSHGKTVTWSSSVTHIVKAEDPAMTTESLPMIKAAFDAKLAFDAAMDDDFNTAGALGALFEMVNRANQILARFAGAKPSPAEGASYGEAARLARQLLGVLGLRAERAQGGGAGAGGGEDKLVELLLKTRGAARTAKQFALGDQVRDGLKALGYEIEDLPGGEAKWKKK